MDQRKKWYLAERVRALATMYLTRRKDLLLHFEEGDRDTGIDLLVEIVNEERTGQRMFGVQLKGSSAPVTVEQANKNLRPSLQQVRRFPELPYPVCLFLFTMEDNAGFFTWVAEPVVRDNAAKLKIHDEAHCAKLDRATLDAIVERVDQWYDVLYATLIA